MSKNYTNYSKPHHNHNKPQVMSEPTPNAENVVAPEEVEDVEITPEELAEIAETVEETLAAEETVAPPPAPLNGVVTAAKLNVRKFPSPGAEVMTVIAQGSNVQIDTTKSTADWYKVYTPAGVEGYCMKKFITVK